MKFVIGTTARPGGSAKDTEDAAKRFLELFAKWTPPAGVTIHQQFTRLDGRGGFVVAETDNPKAVLEASATFSVWYDFEIYPVIDTTDAIPVAQKAMEFRNSVR